MSDFFISYTSVDKEWAEWIAFTLEDEGYSVTLQSWDFRPGANFVLGMQQATSQATRTIIVLSPNYLESQFASPEWAAAFARDPQGLKRTLVPVIVRECKPDGLLSQIVHIDLTGKDENGARAELLEGIRLERAKPSSKPSFPGLRHRHTKPFPGSSAATGAISGKVYVPEIRRQPTDVEKKRFLRSAFETIQTYFELALQEFSRVTPGLEFDFQPVTALEFRVEIFLQGKSVAACRIWQGGMMPENGIYYAEGRHGFGSNSYNEVLTVANDKVDVALSSMMGSLDFSRASENINLNNMNGNEAAEYIWRRFVSNLERRR